MRYSGGELPNRRKPIFALKSGRSPQGAKAARSHTGSLAGSDAAYDAILGQSGIHRVDTIDELFDYATGFELQPLLAGPRIAVVTNAGGPPSGTFMDFEDDAWKRAFTLNLMSVIRLNRAVVPIMREAGGGSIVNLTSISVKEPLKGLVLSNAIRAGVVGLSKTLANEFGPDGIRVNVVCPGFTATERMTELFTARGVGTMIRAGAPPEGQEVPR